MTECGCRKIDIRRVLKETNIEGREVNFERDFEAVRRIAFLSFLEGGFEKRMGFSLLVCFGVLAFFIWFVEKCAPCAF